MTLTKIICWKVAMTALVALLVVGCKGDDGNNDDGGEGVDPTGRCCYDNNTQCSVVTAAECEAVGGEWTQGLDCDSTCAVVFIPTGRCCYDNNTQCSVVTAAECEAVGGEWTQGLDCDSTCAVVVIPTGRCCYDNNTQCSVVTAAECADVSGEWTEGLDCDSTCAVVVVPTGRCCYDNNTQCSVVTAAECADVSGEWTEGLDCDSTCAVVVIPTGRCCYDNNTQCSVVTAAECAVVGGYWAPEVDCNIPCCESNVGGGPLVHWPETYPVDGDSVAVITVSNDSSGWIGNMVFEFYPDSAPNHVRNFKWLTNNGFYDDVIFHRVIEGFVIQGGDPTGTGSGGCGWTLNEEFNDIPHTRGILSMARTSNPNSASSQFFVCHADAPHLNGQYTVFGNLIAGYDVLDRIATTPVQGSRPVPSIRMINVCIQARP